jgi:diacylglycerol kinase family enzyme
MWVQPLKTASSAPEHLPGRAEAAPSVAVLLNGSARRVTDSVVRKLGQVVPQNDLFLSKSQLDARRIAQTIVDRRYDTVFLGGGDGTFMGFVNEIAGQVELRRQHAPNTPMPRFGMLKLGTGNSVASLLKASGGEGILDDVLRARSSEVPSYRRLDLLMVDGKRAPFAGLGLDGKLLNDYIWVKQNLGRGVLGKAMSGAAGYFTSVAFKTVPHYLTTSTVVECEVTNTANTAAYRLGPDGLPTQTIGPGEVLFRGKTMMVAAGTVPFYGFELRMFPFSGKRRGMMHLRLADIATPRILANLPKLWAGSWFPEGMHDFHAREVNIRFERPMPLQIAGDAEGYRESLNLGMAKEPIELVDFTGAVH